MNQGVTENQLGFAFLAEADRPTMAPVESVAEFKTELDAINYSIDAYARRNGYSFTQTHLAGQLGMTKQTLSKLRNGDAAIPRNRFRRLVEVTRSYALIQYHAMTLGLVVRTPEQQRNHNDELSAKTSEVARLKTENAELIRSVTHYKRAMGE